MVASILFTPPTLLPPPMSLSLLPIIITVIMEDDNGRVPVELLLLVLMGVEVEAVVTFNVELSHTLVLLLRPLPKKDLGNPGGRTDPAL